MAFAPSASWNSRSITHLANYPSPSSPMISSDEPSIKAIYPDVYQWWFRLPDGSHDGTPTRAYGFLVYVDIANGGLRKVQLQDWRLEIRNRLGKTLSLEPLNLPDVEFAIGDHRKFLPVLGQAGQF